MYEGFEGCGKGLLVLQRSVDLWEVVCVGGHAHPPKCFDFTFSEVDSKSRVGVVDCPSYAS